MTLKEWRAFPYLDADWRFDFPRRAREVAVDFRPLIDVVRSEGELVLTVELPGLTPDDVDVSLDGDILTIKGEKSEEREVDEEDRYVRERLFGRFQRKITVPDGVTAEGINATFENGVLTVRVQLPEEKEIEPKRIPVSTR